MPSPPVKIIRKLESRYPGMVTLESPVFPEDEARNREFAEPPPPPLRRGLGVVDADPLGARDDSRSEGGGDDPRLAYEIGSLGDDINGVVSGKKIKYDISALPGRQRFEITDEGVVVLPSTTTQALGYYGVGKKAGVDIANLASVMLPTIGEMAAAAEDLRLPRPVITSGRDSRIHKKHSRHYRNLALDYRGNDISNAKGYALGRLVQRRLGRNYDAFFEPHPENPARDHVHVEYDPKFG